jgi:hypothetical protein
MMIEWMMIEWMIMQWLFNDESIDKVGGFVALMQLAAEYLRAEGFARATAAMREEAAHLLATASTAQAPADRVPKSLRECLDDYVRLHAEMQSRQQQRDISMANGEQTAALRAIAADARALAQRVEVLVSTAGRHSDGTQAGDEHLLWTRPPSSARMLPERGGRRAETHLPGRSSASGRAGGEALGVTARPATVVSGGQEWSGLAQVAAAQAMIALASARSAEQRIGGSDREEFDGDDGEDEADAGIHEVPILSSAGTSRGGPQALRTGDVDLLREPQHRRPHPPAHMASALPTAVPQRPITGQIAHEPPATLVSPTELHAEHPDEELRSGAGSPLRAGASRRRKAAPVRRVPAAFVPMDPMEVAAQMSVALNELLERVPSPSAQLGVAASADSASAAAVSHGLTHSDEQMRAAASMLDDSTCAHVMMDVTMQSSRTHCAVDDMYREFLWGREEGLGATGADESAA